MEYDSKNRRKFLLLCHLIFSTKYRRNIFNINKLSKDAKEIIVSSQRDFKIICQETDKDHIHIMVSYDPKISISQIVRHLKQKTAIDLWKINSKILNNFYWKEKTLWADGYFVCSVGNSNPKTIEDYIKNQG